MGVLTVERRDMTIEFKKADLSGLYTKTVLVGDSGDGKSTTALRLATGIAKGGLVLVIDTDNGRANLNASLCDYETYTLREPYDGDHYVRAIDAALALNPAVIVIDTVSEEHAQMLLAHDSYLDTAWERAQARSGGPKCAEWQFREKMSMSGWNKAKEPRKRLQLKLRGLKCHLVICIRCGLKMDVASQETTMQLEGFPKFVSDATASFLLRPNRQGIPDWKPPPSLANCSKLIKEFRETGVNWDAQLTEEHGRVMVNALGSPEKKHEEPAAIESEPEVVDHNSPRLRIETSTSILGLKNIWSEFTPDEKKECKPYLDKRKKELDAEEVKTSREPGEEG